MPANPYIRDVVRIDERLRDYCKRPGKGPVFLLGRVVKHDPGIDLEITERPLIIVADVYDGTNGMINARGASGDGGGARGADGVYPWPDHVADGSGEDRPVGPGGSGQGGGRGIDGKPGGSVTVMCRRSVKAHVSVAGGNGTGGGPGGNGTQGVNGHITPDRQIFVVDEWTPPGEPPVGHYEFVAGQTIPGTPGGNGGWGGPGGAGGRGGTITFTSIVDDQPPILDAAGGQGGPGGPGGAAGPDGYLSEATATEGSSGTDGAWGVDGQVTHINVAEVNYPAGLRPLLDSTGPSYANYWAPFRIVTGEYFYHRYNPSVPERADDARLAAIEFERALELQPDNADAIRLQRQLVGFPSRDGAVWVGGGTNAPGLPRDLDLLPSFDEYINAFSRFGNPVLEFLHLGIDTILHKKTISDFAHVVGLEHRQAAAARDNSSDDLEVAASEQKLAGDEVQYAQQQLDQATSDIQKALVEMQQHPHSPSVTFGDVIGTVAEIGGVVLSVVAAVPTGGASLVALAPAMVALANSLTDNAAPIAKAVFSGNKADTKAVEDAYKAVEKDASAVIKGAKSIVNFVTVIQKLDRATTPDNSKYMALIKRGTELAHQLLIARNRAMLAQQRVDAAQARLTRAAGVVEQAEMLRNELAKDAASIKRAGLLAIATAQSKAKALLGFAFRAQRSVEIYTLQNEEQHLFLDAGLISPDIAIAYHEEEIDEVELANRLISSWGNMLPVNIQEDYTSYFTQPHDQDTLRRSFKVADPQVSDLKKRHQFAFRVNASALPAGHSDAKIKSLRLALVGASHPAGEISCEVRHGGMYEQRRRDNSIATQLLKPRVSTRPAKTTPLVPDEGLGDDPPLTAPRSLAFWGRGVGGEWQVTIPPAQFDSGLDLSGLMEVQVWIGYQFVR